MTTYLTGMMRTEETAFIEQNLDLFSCPHCGEDLLLRQDAIACGGCSRSFARTDHIPQLFWKDEWPASKEDVTEALKAFDEENPSPNYDDLDTVGSLMDKVKRRTLSKPLDDQIPFGTRILECGCGTGQLSNFLSVAHRTVIGVDVCMNSLRLAQAFKQQNDLHSAFFCQMNLLRPCFKPECFDLVLFNGVRYPTKDPHRAFQTIATLVKPQGYILVGFYHKYGRLATGIRRALLSITKSRPVHALDHRLQEEQRPARKQGQARIHHESKHTIKDVLGWLDQAGFTFCKSIPTTVPFAGRYASDRLFEPGALGNAWQRFMVEVGYSITGRKDGGLFVVIAKKP